MKIVKPIAVTAGIAAALWLFLYAFAGGYLLHKMLGRDGWPEMRSDDFRLSASMRYALRNPQPARPGKLVWKTIAPGYDVAELPVISAGRDVDRIYLNRIDPRLYRFTVHNEPHHRWTINDWEKQLPDAALIVNGSFFGRKRTPDTPFVLEGKPAGPGKYDASAGAFVAKGDQTSVVDLTGGAEWQKVFAGADNAMVAYPLLIGADGRNHVKVKSNWLANRTFVAQDRAGRIVIGSTRDAFFSLDRLADFLLVSGLNLHTALNLDGGPVACQSVRLGDHSFRHIARWEAQVSGDRVNLIHWAVGDPDMPIVLAATPVR